MRKLFVIGIGAGNVEHLTVQAINAMNQVDVFFVADKGAPSADLVAVRQEMCQRYVTRSDYRFVQLDDPPRDRSAADYRAAVEAWHTRRVELYEQALQSELGEHGRGAFLVWGDPALYDSTLRIVEQILVRGQVHFEYDVIPGITSVQALAARHRRPLHGIGESVLISTGRNLVEDWQRGIDNVVVMLDGECSFTRLDAHDVDIAWAAYLGLADEVALSGPLSSVGDAIQATRSAARARTGWIMDTYLLRRRHAD